MIYVEAFVSILIGAVLWELYDSGIFHDFVKRTCKRRRPDDPE